MSEESWDSSSDQSKNGKPLNTSWLAQTKLVLVGPLFGRSFVPRSLPGDQAKWLQRQTTRVAIHNETAS